MTSSIALSALAMHVLSDILCGTEEHAFGVALLCASWNGVGPDSRAAIARRFRSDYLYRAPEGSSL